MEILYIILVIGGFYGGIALISWIVGGIDQASHNKRTAIRDEIANRMLTDKDQVLEMIETYKDKLKAVGYSSHREYDYDKYSKYRGVYSELLGKCPECSNNGWLTIRKGPYGKFIGCSNFPKCRHTIEIKAAKQQYSKNASDEFMEEFSKAYNR